MPELIFYNFQTNTKRLKYILENPIQYILVHRRNRPKPGDYAKAIIPCLALLAMGIIGFVNALDDNHPLWIILAAVFCIVSLMLAIYFGISVFKENVFTVIKTRLDKNSNFRLCNDVIQEAFGPVKKFGSTQDGLVSCVAPSKKGKGKQVTLISTSGNIFLNCRDMQAPFSLRKSAAMRKKLKQSLLQKV